MVFSSLEFIFVFLASVLAVYYLVPPKARNIVLLLFSLVFYGWGEPVYVFLMIATITVDYICGYIIGRDLDSKPKRAKVTLIVSIVINLALLGVFKYYDFFAGTLNSLLGRGVFPTLGLTLPIGISFYTFQALSYVIDVYRRDARVQKNIAAFGTYVTLFPQLIAGPIVRYADVDDQLRERTHSLTLFASGCRTFICGLAKKILLANAAGAMWNSLSAAAEPDALGAWLAIVFYTFQIYFDFSGYSDMAIGLGKMFGFSFRENFYYPYVSESITEFWRRWHISLGSWFRDYIYIPLGGSRAGKWKSFRNTLVIFLVSGFWHGANWTFVAWGAYHALLFLPLLLLGQNRRYRDSVAENSFLPSVKELTQMGATFLLVLLGWILFRSEDISQAAVYLERMFNVSLFSAPQLVGLGFGQLLLKKCFFFTALMFVVEWIGRKQAHGLMIEDLSLPVRYVIYTVLLIIIYGFDASNPQGFIYFQF